MADLPPEVTIFGLKLSHLLAGGLGGLSRSLAHPGGSIVRHITTTIVGTVVAAYGTPVGAAVAVRYLGMPDIPLGSMEGVVGFLLGLAGMSLCEAVPRWVRKWRGPAETGK
ncbi:hypothetical protein [Xanthobacter versatilis]|uniref:hypothetical protein n=1 Tax=Xanthobacter autotrophicus (strain ATCC BAA-1158 / Py2) TaxID=78245 RepID=UPI0037266E07